MKDFWRQKFAEADENPPELDFSVLTAFNANIDIRTSLEELEWDLDVEPQDIDEVNGLEDVKSVLKYAREEGRNVEADISGLDTKITGRKSIGGQAGIMANFLSRLNGSVTFYTPLLSQELAAMVDEKVLHPYINEEFLLKNVRDASNTDRTKENIIIEFENGKSGRLVLSDKLQGFGPYFRSGIEENLDLIDEDIDRALVSGFHNAEGNFEAKIEKSRKQLEKIESPVHIEMVDCEKAKFKHILEKLVPHVQSIGFDETEGLKISELFGEESGEKLHIGEAFDISKKLLERSELERVHIHTYRYHLMVTEKDYSLDSPSLRDAMVFGEIASVISADIGEIPGIEDFGGLDFDNLHVKNLDEMEEFAEFFELDDFVEEGFADVEGYQVAAVPTLIHEDPERLVGMGDIISAGAYVFEANSVGEQ